MSNFQLLKVQLVALLEMLEYEYVLTGMSDIPEVSEKEVDSIQEYFSSIGMISVKNGKVIPCKGLEEFMVLLDASEKIMILNYGVIEKCTFNATLYFSPRDLLVILEVNKDVVEFLVIRSLEELRIFIPEVENYVN